MEVYSVREMYVYMYKDMEMLKSVKKEGGSRVRRMGSEGRVCVDISDPFGIYPPIMAGKAGLTGREMSGPLR